MRLYGRTRRQARRGAAPVSREASQAAVPGRFGARSPDREVEWPPALGPQEGRGHGPESGPRGLVRAVLVDALRVLLRPPRAPRARGVYESARAWLLGGESPVDGLFSFSWCCQHLGIDPGRLRRALREGHVQRPKHLERVYVRHRSPLGGDDGA